MALSALNSDEQGILFVQLCNVLDPGVAMAFGSASSELWTLTQAPRQQLQRLTTRQPQRWAARQGSGAARRCARQRW